MPSSGQDGLYVSSSASSRQTVPPSEYQQRFQKGDVGIFSSPASSPSNYSIVRLGGSAYPQGHWELRASAGPLDEKGVIADIFGDPWGEASAWTFRHSSARGTPSVSGVAVLLSREAKPMRGPSPSGPDASVVGRFRGWNTTSAIDSTSKKRTSVNRQGRRAKKSVKPVGRLRRALLGPLLAPDSSIVGSDGASVGDIDNMAETLIPTHTVGAVRAALCFFGLNRSLRWTGASILAHVMAPLDAWASKSPNSERGDVDVFFHDYSLGVALANSRAREVGFCLARVGFYNPYSLRKTTIMSVARNR